MAWYREKYRHTKKCVAATQVDFRISQSVAVQGKTKISYH